MNERNGTRNRIKVKNVRKGARSEGKQGVKMDERVIHYFLTSRLVILQEHEAPVYAIIFACHLFTSQSAVFSVPSLQRESKRSSLVFLYSYERTRPVLCVLVSGRIQQSTKEVFLNCGPLAALRETNTPFHLLCWTMTQRANTSAMNSYSCCAKLTGLMHLVCYMCRSYFYNNHEKDLQYFCISFPHYGAMAQHSSIQNGTPPCSCKPPDC